MAPISQLSLIVSHMQMDKKLQTFFTQLDFSINYNKSLLLKCIRFLFLLLSVYVMVVLLRHALFTDFKVTVIYFVASGFSGVRKQCWEECCCCTLWDLYSFFFFCVCVALQHLLAGKFVRWILMITVCLDMYSVISGRECFGA